uniref:Tabersonine 16-O-methyltransferase n=2 Tax=Catharanthus roseus TaxID=4058 RepID=HTOMT_CATRO|nr:RecName: Full=Tabersonine 16-O-methyltransferase [Catharanthus roseus]ABR20103.1 16-hydroxytabersonine O-methyltransferase [Catharanthus roseus]
MDVQSEEFRGAQAQIWSQSCSFITSASLKCAVKLGIPDTIDNHGKPITLSELTNALVPPVHPSKAPFIYRLMRVLAKNGFCSEEQLDGETEPLYSLTPSSRILLKKEPLNLRGIVLTMADPVQLKAWESLSDWYQNEDDSSTAFETAHGKNFWGYSSEHMEHAEFFNEAMASDSQLISKLLIGEYKFLFEGLASLVDIGGGTGTIAKAIAKNFPQLKCTVFDLPHVVANLESKENVEFVAGDMFEKIPSANAIFLKWILHDWNDEDCVKILKSCKKAIPAKGGKVIIIDMVMYSDKKDDHLVKTQTSMDMAMLVNFAAKERCEKEWAFLFKEAGFSDYKIYPKLDFTRSLIEVYP